jgi:tetratricopeptide (TPR) repeat protein
VSVFAGHFDLEAAEAVGADESLPRSRVLDVISGLVAKSLVIAKEGRYSLLDTIREFARGRLGAAGERDACLRRLTEHLLAMATNGSRQRGRDSLDLLELELYNARPALEWCEAFDPDLGLRLAAALYDVLVARGHVSEARQWFERLLTSADAGSEARVRAHLLAGLLAYSSADPAAAQAHLDVYLSAMNAKPDRPGLADGLTLAGHLAGFNRDLTGACARFEEVLAIRRELGDRRGEAHALHNLAVARAMAGEVEAAMGLFTESLDVRTAIGNRDEGLVTMTFLGAQRYLQGDEAGGWQLLIEAIEIGRRFADRRAAWTLDTLAMIAVRESQPARALELGGAAHAMHAASGTVPSPNWRNLIDPALEAARRELGLAASEAAWARGEALGFDQALEYADVSSPRLGGGR